MLMKFCEKENPILQLSKYKEELIDDDNGVNREVVERN